MLKKNINILVIALLLPIHYGIYCSDDLPSFMQEDYFLEPSSQNSYPYEQQEQSITKRAITIIDDAFKNLDKWVDKNALYNLRFDKLNEAIRIDAEAKRNSIGLNDIHNNLEYPQNSSSYEVSPSRSNNQEQLQNIFKMNPIDMESKTITTLRYFDEALNKLNEIIDAPNMTLVKQAISRAMSTFGGESMLQTPVLRQIVNATKIVLLAPVKIAVQTTTTGIGAAAGAIGGAGAGLTTGLYRTAKNVADVKIRSEKSYNKTIDLGLVAKYLPKVIYRSLNGLVNTALLTAYGAAEGVFVGSIVGETLGRSVTGNIFSLSKQPPFKESLDSRYESKLELEQDSRESKFIEIDRPTRNYFTDPFKKANELSEINYLEKRTAQTNSHQEPTPAEIAHLKTEQAQTQAKNQAKEQKEKREKEILRRERERA